MKNIRVFYLIFFSVFGGEISIYLNLRIFVMLFLISPPFGALGMAMLFHDCFLGTIAYIFVNK